MNKYLALNKFKPDRSAIQGHCGLQLFSKLIKFHRKCTLFMYRKSPPFIVLLGVLTDKDISSAGNNAEVRMELTRSYLFW